FFVAHAERDVVAVVKDGSPVGLITRTQFVERFARPFHHELFDNKSCTLFMDAEPLVVERRDLIADVGARVATHARKALHDGFGAASPGRHFGSGTGQSLVHALADIQLARSRQILESVRYASRIQRALLHASNERMASCLSEHHVFWEPRDGVGGDYYF